MPQEIAVVEQDERDRPGPAMQALTRTEYAFVHALLGQGGLPIRENAKRACREAGLSAGSAQYFMARPRVVAALEEVASVVMRQGTLAAAERVQDLIDNPTHKDHFKALKYILELRGHVVQSEQKITVDHGGMSAAEQRAELRQLMAQMGPEAVRVLAAADVAIDADFTVIDKTALAPDGEPW